MDDTTTWKLIHHERAGVADMLESLAPGDWSRPSLCGEWTVQIAAAHIVAGAEQTKANFAKRMIANGFRFNTMIDRDARKVGALPSAEIIERLRARLTTTNRAPAPVITMLGEVVVHGEDIRGALGRTDDVDPAAMVACLQMYTGANFPVGTKKRIAGLRLAPSDVDWTHGSGPEVTGPSRSLLLAMTGRSAGLNGLGGPGLATLRDRMAAGS